MMMGKLRAASNHIALKIIFVLIILSFVLGGISGYLGITSDDYVAKVNGYKIEKTAFDSEVQNLANRYGYGTLNDDERALYTQILRANVLNDRVNEILIAQYRDELGIQITNQQIKDAIVQTADFQVDGVFDNTTYLETLRRSGYTADSYAEALRAYLGRVQLLQGFAESDFALPVDSNFSLLEGQTRRIYVSTLSTSKVFSEQELSEDALMAYYEKHKNSLTEPEEIKVEFIHLTPEKIKAKITISDKEVADYYKANPDEFISKARYHYSSIQVRTEAEAEAILSELKGGAKFATLAQQKSMYALSRNTGGSLGWFEAKDEIPTELTDAKLTEKGQLSGVMPFSSGYMIVRLDDVEPEQVIPLSVATPSIREQLTNSKVQEQFTELQRSVQDMVINSQSLDAAAALADTEVTTTSWFSTDKLPWGFDKEEIKQAIFSGGLFDENGPTGMNSDVIVVGDDSAFVFRVVDHKNAGIQSFATARASIEAKLKQENALNSMTTKANEILAELNKGNESILQQYDMSFTSQFVLNRQSKEINPALVQKVFAAPRALNDEPVYGYELESNSNATFFVITEVKDATEIKDLSQEVKTNLTNLNLQSLSAGLRQQGDVTITAK